MSNLLLHLGVSLDDLSNNFVGIRGVGVNKSLALILNTTAASSSTSTATGTTSAHHTSSSSHHSAATSTISHGCWRSLISSLRCLFLLFLRSLIWLLNKINYLLCNRVLKRTVALKKLHTSLSDLFKHPLVDFWGICLCFLWSFHQHQEGNSHVLLIVEAHDVKSGHQTKDWRNSTSCDSPMLREQVERHSTSNELVSETLHDVRFSLFLLLLFLIFIEFL